MHFFGRQATQTWILSSFGQSERILILDRLGAISPSWVREQIISQIRQPVHSLFWSFNTTPSRSSLRIARQPGQTRSFLPPGRASNSMAEPRNRKEAY